MKSAQATETMKIHQLQTVSERRELTATAANLISYSSFRDTSCEKLLCFQMKVQENYHVFHKIKPGFISILYPKNVLRLIFMGFLMFAS